MPIAALGSGSDYSPFLQHLGLTTLSVAYAGEDDNDGVYHSDYDSFDHFVRFVDPTFEYGVAEAKTVGRTVLRMANADVLPMQIGAVSETFSQYVQELHKLADDKRKNAEELTKLLDKKAFDLAADPTRRVNAPEREPEVPFLNLAPLDNAIAKLKQSAKSYDDAFNNQASRDFPLSSAQKNNVNQILRGLEQTLTYARGLPGREWYRHLIYAPGLLTGYGVKTMPGVREAIDDNRWNEANEYAAITAKAIDTYCDRLDQATALLK